MTAMDLYETTITDQSAVADDLTRAVLENVPEGEFEFVPGEALVRIWRGWVSVQIIATYGVQGRYTGLEITEDDPELAGAGSWQIICEMEDLPRFLPAILTQVE